MKTNFTEIIRRTQAWVSRVVIGYQLCPFARQVVTQGRVRYVVSEARDEEALLADFVEELYHLQAVSAAETDTTLLIHPFVLNDFEAYHEFTALAEVAIEELGMEGIFQVAGFHPYYQFADSLPTDVENYTNRSPYPMLHLLREASLSEALDHYPDPEAIPQRNIRTMQAIGLAHIRQVLTEL